jgi:hypothetical protein
MNQLLIALVVTAALTTTASARPIAYVDELVLAGGPDAGRARELATEIVEGAGFHVRFAAPGTVPCGDAPPCLADRAAALGVAVALRLTIVEVGGQLSIAMLASARGGATRRQLVEVADPTHPDPTLAATLRELEPERRGGSRRAAWAFVIASAGLAIGGAAATWFAYDLRDRFFADHVAANGDVFGTSPSGARAEERRAQRWSLVGGLALGAAAVTGVTAGIMFVRSSSGEPRPAGVVVALELP